MPGFSASHWQSFLYRRAFALKRSSSSWANFFSKPSSRLSKVVMFASQTDVWDRGKSRLAYRQKIHKSTERNAARRRYVSAKEQRLCSPFRSARLPERSGRSLVACESHRPVAPPPTVSWSHGIRWIFSSHGTRL